MSDRGSDRGPGTRAYLVDTALVGVSGIVLAIWLWDGWPFAPVERTVPLTGPTQAADLGDYFDEGCVTAENLRALAEGRATTISCTPGPEGR